MEVEVVKEWRGRKKDGGHGVEVVRRRWARSESGKGGEGVKLGVGKERRCAVKAKKE